MTNTRDIVTRIWSELSDKPFEEYSFAESLRSYFGHDGEKLTTEDVTKGLRAEEAVPWRDLGWACRESFLGFDPEAEESDERYLIYVAMTCLLADAIAKSDLEWDSSSDFLIKLTYLNLAKGTAHSRRHWFRYLFRTNPGPAYPGGNKPC